MTGSNLTRVSRVMRHLLRHPDDIERYLKTCAKKNCTPLELGLPWIAYSAIDFLDSFIKTNHNIAEYGGGGSTVFFAKRAHSVLCLESNEEWAQKILNKLKELQYNNVQLNVFPYDVKNPAAFKESDYLNVIRNGSYDIILIDACYEFKMTRIDLFYFAENYIKKNGCIIVDDSWRYPELRKKNNAREWKEFRSIGPCRLGVTTTDIYFY